MCVCVCKYMYEEDVSEFPESIEEKFPRYFTHTDILIKLCLYTTPNVK